MPPSKERQRALARAKLERQMARRAADARRRRQVFSAVGAVVAVIVVLAGVVLLWNVVGGKDSDTDATAGGTPTPSAIPGTCEYTKAPAQEGAQTKDVGLPPMENVPHAGTRTATVKTSQGDVVFELDLAKAPCTANSFSFLAEKKYFDKSACHRLTSEGLFVLQCGDPFGTGSGGPGYQFGVENLPTDAQNGYTEGLLAMARGQDPNSNGSQFFIVYQNSQLQPDYTVFGRVTKGLDIIKKVAAAGHDGAYDPQPGGGKPKLPVTINSVTLGPLPTASPSPSVSPSASATP